MIGLSIHSLSLFFLISIRLGAIILFSPLEVIRRLPVQIRLLLLFLSSFLIILNIDAPFQAESLAAAFAAELINSQLFYLSLSACIGCFQIAGHLIDIQNGLNGVSVFKPDAGFDSLSAHLLGMMAALFSLPPRDITNLSG